MACRATTEHSSESSASCMAALAARQRPRPDMQQACAIHPAGSHSRGWGCVFVCIICDPSPQVHSQLPTGDANSRYNQTCLPARLPACRAQLKSKGVHEAMCGWKKLTIIPGQKTYGERDREQRERERERPDQTHTLRAMSGLQTRTPERESATPCRTQVWWGQRSPGLKQPRVVDSSEYSQKEGPCADLPPP